VNCHSYNRIGSVRTQTVVAQGIFSATIPPPYSALKMRDNHHSQIIIEVEPEDHRVDPESGSNKALIVIFSQTSGSTCEFWVNPVNVIFGAPPPARVRSNPGCRRPRPRSARSCWPGWRLGVDVKVIQAPRSIFGMESLVYTMWRSPMEYTERHDSTAHGCWRPPRRARAPAAPASAPRRS
jgi:hypothetical protein